MLHKRFRLRKAVDFERLYSEGQRWHHELAILIIQPNGLENSRIGFSASKRVGKAVDRNQAKRRFREAVRKRLGEVRSGWDFLFVIRPIARTATSNEIDSAVSNLLVQAFLTREVTQGNRGNEGITPKR